MNSHQTEHKFYSCNPGLAGSTDDNLDAKVTSNTLKITTTTNVRIFGRVICVKYQLQRGKCQGGERGEEKIAFTPHFNRILQMKEDVLHTDIQQLFQPF